MAGPGFTRTYGPGTTAQSQGGFTRTYSPTTTREGGGFFAPPSDHVDTSTHQFFHGLWNDIKDTATSVNPAAIMGITDPIGLGIGLIRNSYGFARSFDPLVEAGVAEVTGHPERARKFYDQYEQTFYAHPLAPTLAILSAGRLGGRVGALRELAPETRFNVLKIADAARHNKGAALKAGLLGWDPYVPKTRYVSVQLGSDLQGVGKKGEQISTRKLGRSHYLANRAYGTDKLMKMAPPGWPIIGEAHRVARATRTKGRVNYLRYLSSPLYITKQKTYKKLTQSERVANGMLNRWPDAADLEKQIEDWTLQGSKEAQRNVRLAKDPKIRELYDNPTDNMKADIAAGRDLSNLRTEIMLDTGALTMAEAWASPWRATRIVRGARLATPKWVYNQTRKVDASMRKILGEKGRLVPLAEHYGTHDIAEQIKQGQEHARAASAEFGFQGSLLGEAGHTAATDTSGQPFVDALAQSDAEVAHLREQRDMLAGGQMDTQMMNEFDVPIEKGFGNLTSMEQAMADAAHGKLVKEHTDQLKELQKLEVLAQQRRLTTRQLDELGLSIPSDIRYPTQEELKKATEQRVYRDTLANNLKTSKRMSAEERARVTQLVRDLTDEISKLENPRHIKRSPSTLAKRFESRYRQAEKRLAKEIKKKQQQIADIGEIGVQKDPMIKQRTSLLGILQNRWETAVQRNERLSAAQIAFHNSLDKHLEIKQRQAETTREVKNIQERRIQNFQAARARLHQLNDAYAEQTALRHQIQESTGQLVGGGEPWELQMEMLSKDRPVPYYAPDEMLKEGRFGRLGTSEGSILAQRLRGDIYHSRSILLRTGALALHPDTLSPAYFRAAKHDLNTTMHSIAEGLAIKISKNTELPKGYEYLRRSRGEKIAETTQHRGEHLRAMDAEFGRAEDISTLDGSHPDINFDAADGSKYRLIIPKAYADEFRAESVRSNTAIGKFFTKSMDVWRALVLHLRIPWLSSNIIGNSAMFALRFAGLRGMASFVRMVAANPLTRKYIPGMERLALKHLTDEQVRQLFPEQVRGTHFETQAPDLPSVLPNALRGPLADSKTAKSVVSFAGGVPRALPRLDKWYERKLRKTATNELLRSSPEVKKVLKEMKVQGEDPNFLTAVERAFSNDPALRDWVVQEVNDTLGNFLSLTRHERSILRRVVPFYAWMREITRITGRLAVDHPGKAILLNQLAMASSEMRPEDLPNYMQGAVQGSKAGWVGRALGIGDEPTAAGMDRAGLVGAIGGHTWSPWATVTDLVGAGQALTSPNPAARREFISQFNPYVSGVASYISGNPKQGMALGIPLEIGRSLPQVAATFPYASKLYPERSREDMWMRLFGDPRLRYDPYVAHQQRVQGR